MVMKAVTIDVPREGASFQLVLREGGSPAQAVVVAADDVEIRYGDTAAAPSARAAQRGEKPPSDLDAISQSLLKLHTKTRAAAVDVIKTMFQFTDPVTTETANRILEQLRKRGDLSITPEGEVSLLIQKESVPVK